MSKDVRYKLSKIIRGLYLPLFPFIMSLEEAQSYEAILVCGVREACYKHLVSTGYINPAEKNPSDEIMVHGTFERCGPFARALEAEINLLLGFEAFQFKGLQGHYVVQSKVTKLLYDLVTAGGVSNKEDLDYAHYLNDKTSAQLEDSELLMKYVGRYLAASPVSSIEV